MSELQHDNAFVQLARKIEAILFIATDGATPQEISLAVEKPAASVRKVLEQMRDEYSHIHGIEVVELGGKYFMTSAADLDETLEKFRAADASEHVRLTRASMETLAVIAYSQPVTRSEIEAIRGVRCDRVIDTLLSYGLVRIAGRRKSTGSPLLYRTSPRFLEIFGLGSISDLPTVAELEELKRRSAAVSDVPETLSPDIHSEDGAFADETQ